MCVMIVDDDPWIADLLKQVVQTLRPSIQVHCFGDVRSALEAWSLETYVLVIADWNLPDEPGIAFLKKIREEDRLTPLVMVTGRADRDSVLAIKPLGISAFITKPFDVSYVASSLQVLLPAVDSCPRVPVPEIAFLEYMRNLSDEDLDLPVLGNVKDKLQLGYGGERLDLRELATDWQEDSALCAYLIAASNSAAYLGQGALCTCLSDALRRLGALTSINLAIGLALKQTCIEDSILPSLLIQRHIDSASNLAERVLDLAALSGVDPAPLQTAALLHRMGELCVIFHVLKWERHGEPLDEVSLQKAVDEFAGPFAIRLKAHWGIPRLLRELIGAVYGLPNSTVRKEQVVMRLAAALNNDESPETVDRLKRMAGIA